MQSTFFPAPSQPKDPVSEFSHLLGSLYACLWDKQGMEPALRAFMFYFRCNSASLLAIEKSTHNIRYGWSVGIPEHHKQWYIENDMASKDPAIALFEAGSDQSVGFVAASKALDNTPLIEVVDKSFRPWLEEEKIIDTAGLVIPVNDSEHMILALQRNAQSGTFDQHELRQLDLLAAHIRQCVQLFIRFYMQQEQGFSLQAAIDALPQPTIIINALMKIRHINPAAQKLIDTAGLFTIDNGNLSINDEHTHHQFMYRAWALANSSNPLEEDMNATLVIQRDDFPVTMTLTPMFRQQGDASANGVLLQVFDPAQQALPTAEKIRGIYNISQTEALLCEYLVSGDTIKDVARKRDVSVHTVREQMRNVFLKTGYSRQPELVAAILRTIQ